jgi:CheY-like chemotaxis protein
MTVGMADESLEEEAARPTSACPRGTETILLVEDEAEVRALAHEILERLGYTVLEASVPRDAMLIAQRHVGIIDLLLTDVIMARMSGRALAEAIVAERPETKVLFTSGYTDDAIARHGVLEPGTTSSRSRSRVRGSRRRSARCSTAPSRKVSRGTRRRPEVALPCVVAPISSNDKEPEWTPIVRCRSRLPPKRSPIGTD